MPNLSTASKESLKGPLKKNGLDLDTLSREQKQLEEKIVEQKTATIKKRKEKKQQKLLQELHSDTATLETTLELHYDMDNSIQGLQDLCATLSKTEEELNNNNLTLKGTSLHKATEEIVTDQLMKAFETDFNDEKNVKNFLNVCQAIEPFLGSFTLKGANESERKTSIEDYLSRRSSQGFEEQEELDPKETEEKIANKFEKIEEFTKPKQTIARSQSPSMKTSLRAQVMGRALGMLTLMTNPLSILGAPTQHREKRGVRPDKPSDNNNPTETTKSSTTSSILSSITSSIASSITSATTPSTHSTETTTEAPTSFTTKAPTSAPPGQDDPCNTTCIVLTTLGVAALLLCCGIAACKMRGKTNSIDVEANLDAPNTQNNQPATYGQQVNRTPEAPKPTPKQASALQLSSTYRETEVRETSLV